MSARVVALAICLANADQELVDKLNAAYQAYDPNDDASPAGVMVTAFEAIGEEPYLADCQHCGKLYGLPLKTSNCRISASIINAKNSHIQKDWRMKKLFGLPHLYPLGCRVVGTCDVELALYPVGPFAPLKGEAVPLYDQGGAIFGPAVEQAMKCAYPFDGATVLRPNHGCGCTSLIGSVCPPNKNWPCPSTGDSCSETDPLNRHQPIDENSSVLSACQCANLGVKETDNPLWSGFLGLHYPPGLPKCVWSGPQFFGGKGQNELRQALRQQYNFRKHATYAWNEVVLDGQIYNNVIGENASDSITAFWYPRSSHCGRRCKEGIFAARDSFASKHGVHVPVIMIDITNGSMPFVAVEGDVTEEVDFPLEGQIVVV